MQVQVERHCYQCSAKEAETGGRQNTGDTGEHEGEGNKKTQEDTTMKEKRTWVIRNQNQDS